jgi:hypothetical protein
MARTFLDRENEKYVDRRAAVDADPGQFGRAGRDAIVGVSTQKERLAANWEAMKHTDNVLGPVTVNRSYTTSVENKYGTLGSIRGDGFEDKNQYQVGSNGEPNS